MANKNITSPTAAKIYGAWLKEGRSEAPRTYLGASIVGHDCDMYLWLYFRGIIKDDFDGRMYRLFDRGKREEAVFCADLRRIGCEVKEFGDDGKQLAVSAHGDHFSGHLDGIVRGLDEAPKQWHVVEFKTHSDASFKKLCKEGVMKAKPMHYAQMQTYMGLTGLEAALYMAVDKDNDDLWCERVKFNKIDFDHIMMRAKRIIEAVSVDRCASRPDDFRCKACPCQSVCWEKDTIVHHEVPFTCRTCCHATADTEHPGAKWTCQLCHECSATKEACSDYLILPAFVHADIVDGDFNLINYTVDGNTFSIRKGTERVKELKMLGSKAIATVDAVKAVLPVTAEVKGTNALLVKYGDEENYWECYNGPLSGLQKWVESTPWCKWESPIHSEEFEGKKLYEYHDGYNGTLVIIDGNRARVITENPPF